MKSSKPISTGIKTVAIALLSCLLLFVGCGWVATQKGFYDPIASELGKGDFQKAVEAIETAKAHHKYGQKDRFLYYMDAGLANHYASHFDTSNAKLTQAEYASDELFTKSISRAIGSFILNDNILEYDGEDYEVLYANLIKALNYMNADNFDEAFVEVKRANEKLNLLEQKYADVSKQLKQSSTVDSSEVNLDYTAKKVRFNNDAFARYLSMHMYSVEGKMDDAKLDYNLLRQAFAEQPHIYDFDPPQVRYFSKDKAILSVVGLTGLSPAKEPLNLRIRTDKDLDLVQILYTGPDGEDTHYGQFSIKISEDFYFKFSIPQIVPQTSQVSRIRVSADSVFIGELQLLENVSLVAQETFEAKKSIIYLRSVARAIAKGLATHKAKGKADTGGLVGWLKKAAIDVGSDISENADLRCSRLLPGRIYVGDFEIEPGTYDLTIEFLDERGALVSTTKILKYKILRNGLNLVEGFSLN